MMDSGTMSMTWSKSSDNTGSDDDWFSQMPGLSAAPIGPVILKSPGVQDVPGFTNNVSC